MSWSAKQYMAFEDERTRPVRDLLAALPAIPARSAIDLGCGPGNSTEVLAAAANSRTAIAGADWYYELLRPLCGKVDIWRTTYHHPLSGGSSAIVDWFKGSGLRPFLEPLDELEREAYLRRYTTAVACSHRTLPDGSVLLPFPRLFIVAIR